MGATLVDLLVLIVPYIVVALAFSGTRGLLYLFIVAINAVYQITLLSRGGQTVGNRAVSTRVVDANTGGPISTGKATGRWAGEAVLGIIPFGGLIDVLWPLWDSRNQTLHDKMAGTIVLRTA